MYYHPAMAARTRLVAICVAVAMCLSTVNATNISAISRSWGQYSPYFPAPSILNTSSSLPPSCTLTLVQLLNRHGARSPTADRGAEYESLIAAIQANASSYAADAGVAFLANYSYALGSGAEAGALTPFGQRELYDGGVAFYERYREALGDGGAGDEDEVVTPFFRASAEARVVMSARNWTQGFHAARLAATNSTAASASDLAPYPLTIISEADTSNNTLHHGLCTAFESSSYGDAQTSAFAASFFPNITARLAAALPGVSLTDDQTRQLMDLCPFHYVAADTNSKSTSSETKLAAADLCALFTPAEWAGYNHYQSLDKWYGYASYATPLAPTQGVGFVNELAARLTGERGRAVGTSTNATLDGAADTFPLSSPSSSSSSSSTFSTHHNQTHNVGQNQNQTSAQKPMFYADFSHDNDMTAIFAALGLFNGTAAPAADAMYDIEAPGAYSAARTVPFAARMYVEKMTCGGDAEDGNEEEEEELVRVLLNDAVVPLRNCGADAWGRCRLDRFVESLSFARDGGAWDRCFTT